MTEQELRQYSHILCDELHIDFLRTYMIPRLESYFWDDPDEPNRIEILKQTAKDCVRIKNDMDKRMREYREAKDATA